MFDTEREAAFWEWRDSLNDGQEALLRRFIELGAADGDPIELLGVAFRAGWAAARQQSEKALP